MTTTAKINAKGTKGTGITEDLANRLMLGDKIVAVVELVVEAAHNKRNGDQSVDLSLLTVEPAPDSMTIEHVRELARSFYYERQLADHGPTLDDSIEPKVADVLAAGQRHRPHPYMASTLSTDDNAVCEICGTVETAVVHAERTRLVDPFLVEVPTQLEEDEEGNETEAHTFDGLTPDDTCTICDQDADADIHSTPGDPYDLIHASGRAHDTVCGLMATGGKTLTTQVDLDKVTCLSCVVDEPQPAA